MASQVESVDQTSGRITIWFTGMIALVGMVGYMILVGVMLSKAKEDIASYALALAGIGPLVGVPIGGLVNAMTTRSGGNVDDLQKVVDMTQVAPPPETVPVTHADVQNFQKA